jgi:hypothetical protein
VLTEIGVPPPDGLAERVAEERAVRDRKRRRRR